MYHVHVPTTHRECKYYVQWIYNLPPQKKGDQETDGRGKEEKKKELRCIMYRYLFHTTTVNTHYIYVPMQQEKKKLKVTETLNCIMSVKHKEPECVEQRGWRQSRCHNMRNKHQSRLMEGHLNYVQKLD